MIRRVLVAIAAAGAPLGVAAAPGRAEPDTRLSLTTSLKGAALLAREPDDPALFPERDEAASLWRLRLAPRLRFGERARLELAYEHRLRVAPPSPIAGLGILAGGAPAAYRITPLDWQVASGPAYEWRHEVDRLAASVISERVDVTVGRQALGWGRGVLFSAVDLFAPFSPLEADREWRRGVDAVRAELRLTDTISSDAVTAIGESVDDSVFAARVRGYRGPVDAELVAGWRARDLVAGVTSSAVIGDAELHGELAGFRAPEPLPAGGQFGARAAIKAVLGGSYRFALGNGLPVVVEYHYSGFGVARAEDALALLADPEFRRRFERGDSQILGRHAITALLTYELGPELTCGLRWIQSPRDGSGVVAPTAVATLGDRLVVTALAYLPYGAAPTGLTLHSEYGSAPMAAFVQMAATY